MKRVILLLVGFLFIGIPCSHSIEAQSEETSTSSTLDIGENDGVFVDSYDDKKPSNSTEIRTVKLQKISFEITDYKREATPVSMPKPTAQVTKEKSLPKTGSKKASASLIIAGFLLVDVALFVALKKRTGE